MVLMRRRDKRRGNADEEIIVASDSSIVANKGVRSLQSARSGRFAADMRANVGGYGRPDKTWGVDHPWHTTEQSDLYSALCSRDRMEDGTLLREEQAEREAARGASRAALKKRKAKLKKQGLSAQEAAEIAAKEAEEAKRKHEEEQRLAAEQEAERKRKKSAKAKAVTEQLETEETAAGDDEPIEDKPKEVADTPDEAHEVQDSALSKKQQKKEKKKQKKKAAVEAAKTEEVADLNEQKISATEELKAREMLAKQYEAAFGSEITTESGLVILDQRLGNGKLADLGEMLTVRYRGRLGKEGMVFGKGMLTTKFGTGSVIAGWEEGLGTMRTGGVRRLTIPPELGYGASGKGGKIPPNSTLYFEVELIRFGKRKRDAVGEDEVPLPSSFQRKRIKQKPGKQDGDDEDGEHSGKKRKKNNRRKHKRPISE